MAGKSKETDRNVSDGNEKSRTEEGYPIKVPIDAAEKEPPCPGQYGRAAIFTCPKCNESFVKTSLCCPNCGTQLWTV